MEADGCYPRRLPFKKTKGDMDKTFLDEYVNGGKIIVEFSTEFLH